MTALVMVCVTMEYVSAPLDMWALPAPLLPALQAIAMREAIVIKVLVTFVYVMRVGVGTPVNKKYVPIVIKMVIVIPQRDCVPVTGALVESPAKFSNAPTIVVAMETVLLKTPPLSVNARTLGVVKTAHSSPVISSVIIEGFA
jgi:hypothetical protein